MEVTKLLWEGGPLVAVVLAVVEIDDRSGKIVIAIHLAIGRDVRTHVMVKMARVEVKANVEKEAAKVKAAKVVIVDLLARWEVRGDEIILEQTRKKNVAATTIVLEIARGLVWSGRPELEDTHSSEMEALQMGRAVLRRVSLVKVLDRNRLLIIYHVMEKAKEKAARACLAMQLKAICSVSTLAEAV